MLTMKAVVKPTVAPRAHPAYPPAVEPMKAKSFPIPNRRFPGEKAKRFQALLAHKSCFGILAGSARRFFYAAASVYNLAPAQLATSKFTRAKIEN